ncbi:hypothetical protein JOF56_010076 [Kibdelosporangium banguiense]|uniref:DUF1707 domain-containing protein n=1 Tax=Kibdelosporangium banguiense TaxID=1365924 RepID=A0ABS4TZ87_9PSEU|nr:DUF1707 domain-containing protein [Kibdelosporangium banguiense]MBP2329691.1 hypothetical protein [Kibdelosporangium banguiense]
MSENNQPEPYAFDPRNIRVSDADRQHIAEVLQKAVGQGMLTLDEFTQRTDQALAARTRGELNSVVIDLPGLVHAEAPTATARPPANDTMNLRTRTGTVKQNGDWVVPSRINAECTMGTVHVDFTHARCPHKHVTLHATCGSGTILVIVPRGWLVRMEDITTGLGNVVNRANDAPDPAMPILHMHATVGMGTIKIKHSRGR